MKTHILRSLSLAVAAAALVILQPGAAIAQYPPFVIAPDFDGRDGFTVTGVEYGQFGDHVAGIGDVNADGYDDIASGASGQWAYSDCWCEEIAGMVHVIFGGPEVGGTGQWTVDALDGVTGFRIPEIGYRDSFGLVSPAGDFNNDGIDDFLVGAPGTTHSPDWECGAWYLIYGTAGLGAEGTFDVASLDGTNGFAVYGGADGARIVASKNAPIGDFNADGVDDLLFSSIDADADTGACYVVFGGLPVGQSGEFSLANLTPETGIVIKGVATGYRTGWAQSAGDFNGDGYPDILIGTSRIPVHAERNEAYVVFGGPDVGSNGLLALSSLDGTNGFVIRPAGAGLGFSTVELAGFGDINGDGYADVAISDWDGEERMWADVIFGGADVGATGEVEVAAMLANGRAFRIIDDDDDLYGHVRDSFAVGDLNNDGYNEFGAKAGYHSPWIVYGGPHVGQSGTIVLAHGVAVGREMFGAYTSGRPTRVARAGDINNDGLDDFMSGIIYEEHYSTSADYGKLDVFFGRRLGDFDLDGDLDLDDYTQWGTCMLGPAESLGILPGCVIYDFTRDGLIDLRDFAGFQEAFQR